MAESDLELIRRGFDALEAGDAEGLIHLVHPDFEMTTPAALASEPDTYRGADGVRRYFDSFYEAMDEVGVHAERFEDLGGGRVLTPSILRARGRSTGLVAEQRVVLVWEVRDQLVQRLNIFASEEEAQEATGT
jgi:ketosteroid isomerase-like protein